MSDKSKEPRPPTWRERCAAAWDRFWFTPRDPTLLGLIRICCGLITLYTALAYTFTLDQFMGPHAWFDLDARMEEVHNRPWQHHPLNWDEKVRSRPPRTKEEADYYEVYIEEFGGPPPLPYPASREEAELCHEYLRKFGFDLRYYNLPIPQTKQQRNYLIRFTKKFGKPPAPPYPSDLEDNPNADPAKETAEEKEINAYIDRYGLDPRQVYTRGQPVWSIWFHVTDPTGMMVVHVAIMLVTFLFVIGFCTRITSVLTWLGALSYIQRNPYVLFGVDTMMNIVLIYLMIGPSGAALSVDRVLGRWWSKARPRVLARWRAFWGRPAGEIPASPPPPERPAPAVSANVAIRLLQIHVCIIYLVAGLSKLQGGMWWRGEAVWHTLANFEFAPMQYPLYNAVLRVVGQHRLVFEAAMTISVYFTLFFEIAYAFLIWRPATRWVILGMAIILHGFIGLFMGLKTFSLMMLVMNMAFLKPNEVHWIVSRITGVLGWFGPSRDGAEAPKPPAPPEPVSAGRGTQTAIKAQRNK